MNSDTPYQAPSSDIIHQSNDDEFILNEIPASYGAGAGLTWIKEGFGLFKSDAGLWIGMIVVFTLINFVMGFVPLIGGLATIILGPVFTGGLMIAARNIEQGQGEFNDLFAGFKNQFAPLALLGLIYFGIWIAFMGLFMVFGIGSLFLESDPAMLENTDVFGAQFFVWIAVGFVFFIAVMMGMIFAPSLIIFNQYSSWNAFVTSFKACLSNILPLIVFMVVGLLLSILAIIPLGLGMLVLMPTMTAAIYKGYKMIFIK